LGTAKRILRINQEVGEKLESHYENKNGRPLSGENRKKKKRLGKNQEKKRANWKTTETK